MKISAIIPSFNRAQFLPRALQSIFDQDYSIDEIIVVDDGSNDETAKLVNSYENVRYIFQNNSGVASARNRGVKAAKNEWLAFLDSDDTWHHQKTALQVDFHKHNPQILFSHTAERWFRDGKERKYPKHLKKPFGYCFENLLDTCKIAASSVMFHKDVLNKVGLFDENYDVCEDYELWLRVAYEYDIGLIEEALVNKYAGHDQLSNSIKLIDIYHIKALMNFLKGKHKDTVVNSIKSKCEILQKGAQKRDNKVVLDFCKEVLKILE